MTHGPGWEVADCPLSPVDESSRHTCVSVPGSPDVTAHPGRGTLAVPPKAQAACREDRPINRQELVKVS